MKILVVGYSTNIGGAEKRMISFVNYTSKNHDVVLVTFKKGNKLFDNEVNPDVNSINYESGINIVNIAKLIKLIREEQPNKVYGFLGHINVVLGLIKYNFPKIPFIVRENATYSEYFAEKGIKGKVFKILYKIFLKKNNFIVSQSHFMKEELFSVLNVPKDKISILRNPWPDKHNYVEEDFIFEKENKYLLSVGRLEPVKNQAEMIKLLELLPSHYHLLLVGNGVLHNDLQALAQRMKLNDRVHFIGFTNNTGYYYVNSDLLLLTSLRETSPNVVLEATKYELFTVSYNMPGGIEDVIQEEANGVLVDQNKIKSLARNVVENIEKKAKKPNFIILTENEYNKELLITGDDMLANI